MICWSTYNRNYKKAYLYNLLRILLYIDNRSRLPSVAECRGQQSFCLKNKYKTEKTAKKFFQAVKIHQRQIKKFEMCLIHEKLLALHVRHRESVQPSGLEIPPYPLLPPPPAPPTGKFFQNGAGPENQELCRQQGWPDFQQTATTPAQWCWQ